jgi:hypothetical protein
MIQELTASVRRWAGLPVTPTKVALVPFGAKPAPAVMVSQLDVESLRGVSDAAADQAPCECPESCERDHANE